MYRNFNRKLIKRRFIGLIAALVTFTSMILPLRPAHGSSPSAQDVLSQARAEEALRVYQEDRLVVWLPEPSVPTRTMADSRGAMEQHLPKA